MGCWTDSPLCVGFVSYQVLSEIVESPEIAVDVEISVSVLESGSTIVDPVLLDSEALAHILPGQNFVSAPFGGILERVQALIENRFGIHDSFSKKTCGFLNHVGFVVVVDVDNVGFSDLVAIVVGTVEAETVALEDSGFVEDVVVHVKADIASAR